MFTLRSVETNSVKGTYGCSRFSHGCKKVCVFFWLITKRKLLKSPSARLDPFEKNFCEIEMNAEKKSKISIEKKQRRAVVCISSGFVVFRKTFGTFSPSECHVGAVVCVPKSYDKEFETNEGRLSFQWSKLLFP